MEYAIPHSGKPCLCPFNGPGNGERSDAVSSLKGMKEGFILTGGTGGGSAENLWITLQCSPKLKMCLKIVITILFW